MLAYVSALLVVILRGLFGPDGPQSTTLGILAVLAVAAPMTWHLCRDLYSEKGMLTLRQAYGGMHGSTRAKEAAVGILFLVGGVVSLAIAAYVATR